MATPGPAFFEQIERDERQRCRASAKCGGFLQTPPRPIFNERKRDDPPAAIAYSIRRRRATLEPDTWSVGEVICDHAERLGATAIVMAPHGRGACASGSRSACRHCLRRSKVALVIVRPDYQSTRAEEDAEAKQRGK